MWTWKVMEKPWKMCWEWDVLEFYRENVSVKQRVKVFFIFVMLSRCVISFSTFTGVVKSVATTTICVRRHCSQCCETVINMQIFHLWSSWKCIIWILENWNLVVSCGRGRSWKTILKYLFNVVVVVDWFTCSGELLAAERVGRCHVQAGLRPAVPCQYQPDDDAVAASQS